MIEFLISHKVAFLTLTGALIVAFGAFKSSIDQAKAEKKLSAANEVIRHQTSEIRELSKLTVSLQDKTIKELIHQTSMLTGGNTYPVLTVSDDPKNNPGIYTAQLFAVGKYPLHNFSIQIHSQNHTNKVISTSFGSQEIKQSSPLNIPELKLDINKNPTLKLIIRFSARNGIWTQEIEFRKNTDKTIQYRTIVYSDFDKSNPLTEKKFEDGGLKLGVMVNLDSLKYQK